MAGIDATITVNSNLVEATIESSSNLVSASIEADNVVINATVNEGTGGKGDNGKSAYEIAVEHGFVGTEVEWLASLKPQYLEDFHSKVDGGDTYDPPGESIIAYLPPEWVGKRLRVFRNKMYFKDWQRITNGIQLTISGDIFETDETLDFTEY